MLLVAGFGEAAAVTIAASWFAIGTPAVRVVMDTHSVDLDGFDLATLAHAVFTGRRAGRRPR